MNRKDKILKYINSNKLGIEIGPSHNPVAPKKDGFNVHIIDHMSKEELIEKYKSHPIDLTAIEEVDFVWSGQPYVELTNNKKHYDWVIASHVIEHTPDLIGFLLDCDSILRDDGVVSLVVPDKRYCFDHFRPVSSLAKVIDNHMQKHTIHSAGTVAEYFLNVVAKNGNIGWDKESLGEYSFVHTINNAIEGINAVTNEKKYIDVHEWCFTPSAFRLMIHDLHNLGLIPFTEVEFFETDGHEFYMTLGYGGNESKISRLELVKKIELELQEKDKTSSSELTFKRRIKNILLRVRNLFS